MTLRDYQRTVFDSVNSGWSEFRKQLVVMPTGSGKTVVFAHLAAREAMGRPSGRTLILAHREELIDQAVDKIRMATGIEAEVEKAEREATLNAPVVVASVQTLLRRLERWPSSHFSLVVCDEAHHAISNSWQTVLCHFDEYTRVLGVTATPDRGDQRNLGTYFENVAAEVGLFGLINSGYLSRISVRCVPLAIDLSRVRSTAGDLDAGDIDSALDPYLGQIAQAIKEHASFRRVLCFLPLISTSHKFVAACQSAGLTAQHIDGISPDRKDIIERFGRWEFDVLSNAMLLTEGFDSPGIDCVVVLRPTRSRPLYAQMVGRGTRIAEGKEDLLLLDFLWHHERHSITRPAHLIASTETQASIITDLSAERTAGGGRNGTLDLQALDTDASAQREDRLAQELALHSRKRGKLITSEEFALSVHQPDLIEWEPTMRWESAPITAKQTAILKRAHVDVATVRGRGHASKLIDLIFRGRQLKLASPKQQAMMRRMGYPNSDKATEDEARRFFAGIRQNQKNK